MSPLRASRGKIVKTQRYATVNYKEMSRMKPVLCYLFPSSTSLQDKETGKYSHVDLFNVIIIPKALGSTVQTFTVAGRINNVPTGQNISLVQLIDESGAVMAAQSLSGVLDKGDVQFYARFESVLFKKPGRYYLKVDHNGKSLADGQKFYIDVRKEE